MIYFVTGGSGFIGKRLVRRLLERPGASVYVLMREATPERMDALVAGTAAGEDMRSMPAEGKRRDHRRSIGLSQGGASCPPAAAAKEWK